MAEQFDCEAPLVTGEGAEAQCHTARPWHVSEALLPGSSGEETLLSDDAETTMWRQVLKSRVARALGAAVACGALCTVVVVAMPRTATSTQAEVAEGLIRMDAVAGSWAGAGRCGIATNMLDGNDAGMSSFCSMDLDFWWNWAPVPRNAYSAACAWPKFVPMIWGSGKDNKWIARKAGETFGALMGYNEPDLWGPPPYPGGPYLSSGTFTPTFHCGSPDLANEWRDMVMFYKQTSPWGTVVSPSMADPSRFASAGPDAAACEASPQTWDQHMPWCLGWMKCFKENVIRLDCGGVNCWDAIDVLQFHAYEYDAQKLIDKVKGWESTWADDLQGINGRKKKTLWLTEFAHAGTTDSNDPDGQATAFMEQSVAYLKSSPYVSGWSWFSQTFSSFNIDGVVPASQFWASELITKDGQITRLGRKYQEICAQIPPTPVLA